MVLSHAGFSYLFLSDQETRPDFINRHELRKLRRFGCTRVQLGLQHVENDVLKYINRGCERRDAIRAIRMLKDSGYKVDVHIMPDLPSSSPEKDLIMFFYLLSSPDLQADQWKVYPCEVTPFSEIEVGGVGGYSPDRNPLTGSFSSPRAQRQESGQSAASV